MKFKLIKTTEDYQEAIAYLEQLGDTEGFHENESLMEEFELISTLIGLYEKEHFPLDAGHPIEIIKLKMEYLGLKRKDLVKMVIGSSGVLSEVFNKKRGLSKNMIREFSKLLDIDQNLLNPTYPLEDSEGKDLRIQVKPIKTVSKAIFHYITKEAIAIQTFKNRTRKNGMLFNLNVA